MSSFLYEVDKSFIFTIRALNDELAKLNEDFCLLVKIGKLFSSTSFLSKIPLNSSRTNFLFLA